MIHTPTREPHSAILTTMRLWYETNARGKSYAIKFYPPGLLFMIELNEFAKRYQGHWGAGYREENRHPRSFLILVSVNILPGDERGAYAYSEPLNRRARVPSSPSTSFRNIALGYRSGSGSALGTTCPGFPCTQAKSCYGSRLATRQPVVAQRKCFL